MKNSQYDALVEALSTFVSDFAMQEAVEESVVRDAVVAHLEQDHGVRFHDGMLDDLLVED